MLLVWQLTTVFLLHSKCYLEMTRLFPFLLWFLYNCDLSLMQIFDRFSGFVTLVSMEVTSRQICYFEIMILTYSPGADGVLPSCSFPDHFNSELNHQCKKMSQTMPLWWHQTYSGLHRQKLNGNSPGSRWGEELQPCLQSAVLFFKTQNESHWFGKLGAVAQGANF